MITFNKDPNIVIHKLLESCNKKNSYVMKNYSLNPFQKIMDNNQKNFYDDKPDNG